MAACKRMPIDTGAPGWESGFGAVCVGGSGGGARDACTCSSETCLLSGGSAGALVRGFGVVGVRAVVVCSGFELSGSCDSGRPLGLLLATTLGVVGAAALEAVATDLPGIAVATRYWLQA